MAGVGPPENPLLDPSVGVRDLIRLVLEVFRLEGVPLVFALDFPGVVVFLSDFILRCLPPLISNRGK